MPAPSPVLTSQPQAPRCSRLQSTWIACETIAYEDYVASKGEAGARDAGKMRVEGKEYVVRAGDVLLFRFNV